MKILLKILLIFFSASILIRGQEITVIQFPILTPDQWDGLIWATDKINQEFISKGETNKVILNATNYYNMQVIEHLKTERERVLEAYIVGFKNEERAKPTKAPQIKAIEEDLHKMDPEILNAIKNLMDVEKAKKNKP